MPAALERGRALSRSLGASQVSPSLASAVTPPCPASPARGSARGSAHGALPPPCACPAAREAVPCCGCGQRHRQGHGQRPGQGHRWGHGPRKGHGHQWQHGHCRGHGQRYVLGKQRARGRWHWGHPSESHPGQGEQRGAQSESTPPATQRGSGWERVKALAAAADRCPSSAGDADGRHLLPMNRS